MKGINEEIREKIREILLKMDQEKDIQEYDLLYKTKDTWDDAKKDIRKELVLLLKNLENDDYKDGIGEIDKMVLLLKKWKDKIQKKL